MWHLLLSATACVALRPLKATTCPKYSCGSGNDFGSNQCIQANSASNSYLVQECYGNTTCSPTVGYADAYCQPSTSSGPCIGCVNSGDPCAIDINCVGTQTCNSGFCSGSALGQACTNDAYCLPGLFCNLTLSTCQQLYKTGDTGCLSEFHCNNQAGCNSTSGLTGNCVAYMSVPNGGVIETCDCASSYSLLCSSLTCSCTTPFSTEGTCIPAFVNSELKKPCDLGSSCTGVNSEGSIFKSECVCGNNPEGEAYCQPMGGDKPALDLYGLLKTHYINPNVTYCNTKSRGQGSCYLEVEGSAWTAEFMMYYYYFINYPLFQNNDRCTQVVYNDYYWSLYYELNPNDPDDKDDDDDDRALAGFALLAGLSAFL